MKNFCLALVMLAVVPAVALAGGGGGGGGSKPSSFIKVTNTSPFVLGVIVQPGNAPYVLTTKEQFEKDGGKYIPARGTLSFSVKEGNQTVSAAYPDAANPPAGGDAQLVVVKPNTTYKALGNNRAESINGGVDLTLAP